jgi:flagellar basal-body rod protein FlgC
MEFFPEMQIAASGLTAERARLEVIAGNIANVNTTQTSTGEVFRRQLVELVSTGDREEGNLPSVNVAGVVPDQSPLRQVYDPANPRADEKGFVNKPNVDVMLEMVDMLGATRSYQANVTAIQSSKEMIRHALEI